MKTQCPYCDKESEDERLSVVSVDGKEYFGTLWRCSSCGVIGDESGNEVSL